MFFVLSKLLGFFAIPSNLVVLIGIVGLSLLPTRFASAGRWLAFVSLVVLAILGLSPVGNALIIPLEHRFSPRDATRGAPDGIVVLGGAIDGLGPRQRCGIERGGRTIDRGARVSATLSQCPHPVFGWQCRADRW